MSWANIMAALEDFWDVIDSCITFITTNAALMAIFAASLIPIGFKIFKKAKRAVK